MTAEDRPPVRGSQGGLEDTAAWSLTCCETRRVEIARSAAQVGVGVQRVRAAPGSGRRLADEAITRPPATGILRPVPLRWARLLPDPSRGDRHVEMIDAPRAQRVDDGVD